MPQYTPPTGRRLRKKSKTHPLLLDTKAKFSDIRKKRFFDDGYLKPKTKDLPDILVSEQRLDRAVKLANTLYTALEDAGHWVRIAAKGFHGRFENVNPRLDGTRTNDPWRGDRSWSPSRPTLVYVGGVAIGLTLFEQSESLPCIYGDGDYRLATKAEQDLSRERGVWRISKHHIQNGRFSLVAYSPYGLVSWSTHWAEEKRGDFREFVPRIVETVEGAAPVFVERAAQAAREAEERKRQYEEEQHRRHLAALEQAKKDAHKKSRDQLVAVIEGWMGARQVEQFFGALQDSLKNANEEERNQLAKRMQLARSMCAQNDALAHFERWQSPEELYSSK